MARTANVFARVEPEVKEQAEQVLDRLGIPMSNAVGMFLRQIVLQRGIPFEMKLPAYEEPVAYGSLKKKQFDAEEDAATILGVFSTGPSIPSTGWNIVSEAVATFVLVFAIKGMAQVGGMNGLQGNVAVYVIILACGMSFGGTTGYAMNPARDLGPRLAHACLPIKNKGTSNFAYGLVVPIFGPIIGALLAVGLYAIVPWA